MLDNEGVQGPDNVGLIFQVCLYICCRDDDDDDVVDNYKHNHNC